MTAGAAKRILLSVILQNINKRQKKAAIVAANSEQFTANETGKGQFLWGYLGNVAKEIFAREISSLGRIAGCRNFAITEANN